MEKNPLTKGGICRRGGICPKIFKNPLLKGGGYLPKNFRRPTFEGGVFAEGGVLRVLRADISKVFEVRKTSKV